MKIYVDELPKSCEECPMCRSGKLKLQRKGRYVEAEQCVFGQYKYQTMDDEIYTCPLLLLTDYTKQVRKEVCEEIKSEIIKHHEWKYEDCYTNSDVIECVLDIIEENLDQIQGENNVQG